MPSKSPSLTYRRLRAPRTDGEILLEPSWSACVDQPGNNAKLFDSFRGNILGRPLQTLRQQVRRDLVKLTSDYTSQYATSFLASTPNELEASQPLIVTGHQPRLFHPGVWAKNFVTAELAGATNGIPVHVIIDNDVMREHSMRIPTGTNAEPRVVVEAFDAFAEPAPFENRHAIDRELLDTFSDRVLGRVSSLVSSPLITELWPKVLRGIDRGKPLGAAFAEARHLMELAWGLRTLEVPLSDLCDTESFRWFAFWLLKRGETLTAAYNRRLHEYRSVHKLRSQAQPLPDLATRPDDGWTEAPFWLWTKNNAARQSLWWKTHGDDLLLSDESHDVCWTIPKAMNTPEEGFEVFEQYCEEAFSIRPRALTNTMFLRLFASDTFIHGIGGAKYDQITDLIMADLFRELDGYQPPEFIAVSQTTLLPTGASLVSHEQYTAQKQKVRQMHFHPERFLNERERNTPKVSCIEENKLKLLELDLPKGQRAARHQGIEAANAELRGYLLENREIEEKCLAELEQRLAASEVLTNREWSFCLFPEEFLQERLLDLKRRRT